GGVARNRLAGAADRANHLGRDLELLARAVLGAQTGERLVELVRGREAVLALALERLENDRPEVGRDPRLRVGLLERKDPVQLLLLEELGRRLPAERQPRGQELVQDDAQRVEVAAPVERLAGGDRAELLR